MRIEELTVELSEKFRSELAQLYFDNVRSNAFYSHYTYEEAYEKMDDLIGHLRTHTAVVFGAFEGEELVAFIWSYVHQFREEGRMYVSEIRVEEEYRNRGIGRQLLKSIEDKAKELGINAVYLHAEAGNKEVRKLYQAYGYMEERIQMRKEFTNGLRGDVKNDF